MNFAINTFIIFFLFVLPGVIFRRGYYSKTFSKQFIKTSPFDIFMSSLIPGVVIQVVCVLFVNTLIWTIDFKSVLSIMSSNEESFNLGISALIANFNKVACFFLLQMLFSWLTGRFLKGIVRGMKLDIRYKLFRFRNKWHYILKGEIIHFPENQVDKQQIGGVDYTYVDAMTTINDQIIIYSGVLSDYHLTDQGSGLEHIELTNVYKRNLTCNTTAGVPSDTFILPFQQVVNINLTYTEDADKKSERAFKKQNKFSLLVKIGVITSLLSIPLVYFQFDLIENSWYNAFFKRTGFWSRTFTWISFFQVISLLVPSQVDKVYTYSKGIGAYALNCCVATLFISLACIFSH
jgi:hypothetical protein